MKAANPNRKIIKNKKRFVLFAAFASLLSFLLKVYRLPDFLGFYFDQGRDALIIWDFLEKGKLFLVGPVIGPTMGVGDVPRGPWYYFLITPFYWLGSGNPLYPSVFLIFTTVLASFFLSLLAFKVGGFYAGLVSLFVASFSFDFVLSSRWLANPTPLYFLSVVFLYLLFEVTLGKRYAMFAGALLAGFAFHFGSSADFFYLPILLIIIFIFSKKLLTSRNILFSFLFYSLPFFPQIIFDLRHNGIIRKGLVQFIESGRFYNLDFETIVNKRLLYYPTIFLGKILPQNQITPWVLFFFFIFLVYIFRKNLFSSKYFIVSGLSLLFPLLGMIFFKGEKGVIYDYYFTGFFFISIFIFSLVFSNLSSFSWGKKLFFSFVFFFLIYNSHLFYRYFKYDSHRFNPIVFSDQVKAVDWILCDAKEEKFNVDFYVPPVIPYSYEYLLRWRGEKTFGGKFPTADFVDTLYTIQEPDFEHPDRLERWRKRQENIAAVQQRVEFGLLLVEKRIRLTKNGK